jgi:hypothetical protein
MLPIHLAAWFDRSDVAALLLDRGSALTPPTQVWHMEYGRAGIMDASSRMQLPLCIACLMATAWLHHNRRVCHGPRRRSYMLPRWGMLAW